MPIVSTAEQSLTTEPKLQKSKIKWILEYFRILDSLGRAEYTSKSFKLTGSPQTCSLQLAICKDPTTSTVRYKMKFILEACRRDSINLIISASIVEGARSAKKVVKASSEARKVVDLFDIPDKDILSYLNNDADSLSIECEIDEVTAIVTTKTRAEPVKSLSMVKKFDQFYANQRFCDLTFVVGPESIKAHSLVLRGISSYFKAMLEADMSEARSRTIDLSHDQDITFEVLKGFLDYVYGCRKIEEMEDLAFELMILADKFEVSELVGACENLVAPKIDERNVGKILLFSRQHHCDNLLRKAIAFAKSCRRQLTASPEFPELSKDSILMSELFC